MLDLGFIFFPFFFLSSPILDLPIRYLMSCMLDMHNDHWRSSPLDSPPVLLFCVSTPLFFSFLPLKFQLIFWFKEKEIRFFFVLLDYVCVQTWQNCYSLILRGCLIKRIICIEFYSMWHESTFKDNAIHVILYYLTIFKPY